MPQVKSPDSSHAADHREASGRKPSLTSVPAVTLDDLFAPKLSKHQISKSFHNGMSEQQEPDAVPQIASQSTTIPYKGRFNAPPLLPEDATGVPAIGTAVSEHPRQGSPYTTKESKSSTVSGEKDFDTHNLKSKAASGQNPVIAQFEGRGKQGRRLTFLMQEVPDVLVKGDGNMFVEEAQKICGDDIRSEIETSSDEEWTPRSIEDDMTALTAPFSEKDFDDSLTEELMAANDETDRLCRIDTLHEENHQNRPQDNSVNNLSTREYLATDPGAMNKAATNMLPQTSMDTLQLRLWFIRVKKSYIRGVKVVKVSKAGHKYVRGFRITDKFLVMGRQANANERKCHLSCVRNTHLGFASDNFRKLLDITLQHFPVSEQARNECLLLLRVLVRQAKRRYGDNSGSKDYTTNAVL